MIIDKKNGKKRHLALAGCALGAILTFTGCGASAESDIPRAAVEGKVRVDGQPLAVGLIRFVPAQGTAGPKISAKISDGAFSAPAEAGPPVGSHRVEIESLNASLAVGDEELTEKVRAQGKLSPGDKPLNIIPQELTANVTPDGPNQFEFDLKTQTTR